MRHSVATAAAYAMVVAGSVAGLCPEAQALEQMNRYCAASWRQAQISPQDWADCTQEVLMDLLNRISRERLPKAMCHKQSAERRELNRAIWATAQRWRRARRASSLGTADIADERTSRQATTERIRADLAERFAILPELQRQIMQQTLDGASVAEIAAALQLPAPRVSDEKYKAIGKLRQNC